MTLSAGRRLGRLWAVARVLGRRGRPLAALAIVPLLAFLGFLTLDKLAPFPFEDLVRPASTRVLDRDGRILRAFLSPDQKWRFPVGHDELPAELVGAVILQEDRWYRFHPGVNPLAVIRATWSNLRAGRIVSGASTIPMQIARMASPRPRTLKAKLVESFRALQLRWHLPEERLIDLYFNLAPYGGNIEGVGAAAWFYFGKRPRSLSLGEMAMLAALPRSPNGLDPTRHPSAARRERAAVLRRLVAAGRVARARAERAMDEPLPLNRTAVPMEAPHVARYLREKMPDTARIESTIDLSMQQTAESVLEAHAPALRARGIGNVAAVVMETGTRAVRAFVGSAGFDEPEFEGQVDGALARRSPGSTLKPFLYAAALDEGIIIPDSWVLDIPIDFSGYVAENYDGVYEGRVTASEALRRSLNAPAVWLLSRLGLERFLALLRAGGLETLDRPASAYGLPLVLGAGEVRLLDLVNLYATLADGGAHRSAVLLAREERAGGGVPAARRLFSGEASALVMKILEDVERPDLPESWTLARGVPAIAWKTGTSFGHRDAWAVGTAGGLAIGVWLGNFDGTPVKGISGSRQAGPVLMDLVRALARPRTSIEKASSRWLDIGEMDLCALSHERPGPYCSRRIRGVVIEGRSRVPECSHHRRVFLDEETGALLDSRCLAGRTHRTEIIERYPPELAAFWRAQGRDVPGHAAGRISCGGRRFGEAPRIVTPDPSTPYRLRRDAPALFQKIPLLARLDSGAEPDREQLFWYQDGRLVASGRAGKPLYVSLESGTHRMVVVDGAGRSDSVIYTVEN